MPALDARSGQASGKSHQCNQQSGAAIKLKKAAIKVESGASRARSSSSWAHPKSPILSLREATTCNKYTRHERRNPQEPFHKRVSLWLSRASHLPPMAGEEKIDAQAHDVQPRSSGESSKKTEPFRVSYNLSKNTWRKKDRCWRKPCE